MQPRRSANPKRRANDTRPTPGANWPSLEQRAVYDRLMPMLIAAHEEVSKLSAKKQDGVLNPLKIRNINRLLEQLKPVLSDDPAMEFLETLDEETLPQNSDGAFLLGQWIATLERFKKQYARSRGGVLTWIEKEELEDS